MPKQLFLIREKWAASSMEWTHLSLGPVMLPVTQPFHFSFQLKGISTVWISKRERKAEREGKKKEKEICDKTDGEELNQVQLVTISSIFFFPLPCLNTLTTPNLSVQKSSSQLTLKLYKEDPVFGLGCSSGNCLVVNRREESVYYRLQVFEFFQLLFSAV